MIRAALLAPLLTICLAGQAPAGQPAHPPSTPAERAVVLELAKIRVFPREYAKYLRALGTRFQGSLWRLRDHVPIRTNEGRAAVLEAAEFLEQVQPISARVAYSEALHFAARDHVLDQGPTGQIGHTGRDGSKPSERMRRYGSLGGEAGFQSAEVINFGNETPRMTVIQLVIDDGVADRGHRKAIFNPALRVAGAAIGGHKEYGSMTVVDLADAIAENR